MRLTPILISATALASASAIAVANQAHQRSQGESQPMAQQSQPSQSSHSPEVIKQVQEKLNAAGYDAGPADGMLGAKTEQALTTFQGAKGLEASGRLDTQTLAELQIDPAAGSASVASASGSTGASPEQRGTGTGGSADPGPSPERTAEPKLNY